MLVAKTKENLKKCKCMSCPSYTLGCKIKNVPENMFKLMDDLDNLQHYEAMYCAFEKSHCIDEDKGCLCETCPIHDEYDLHREDYCLKTGGSLAHKCVMGFDTAEIEQVEQV